MSWKHRYRKRGNQLKKRLKKIKLRKKNKNIYKSKVPKTEYD